MNFLKCKIMLVSQQFRLRAMTNEHMRCKDELLQCKLKMMESHNWKGRCKILEETDRKLKIDIQSLRNRLAKKEEELTATIIQCNQDVDQAEDEVVKLNSRMAKWRDRTEKQRKKLKDGRLKLVEVQKLVEHLKTDKNRLINKHGEEMQKLRIKYMALQKQMEEKNASEINDPNIDQFSYFGIIYNCEYV